MKSSRQWALITGASSGIGFELACCFADDGHNLVITSEDEAGLRAAAETLQETSGGEVRHIVRDLSHPDGALTLYSDIARMELPIEYLVNNAGVGVYGRFADKTDLQSEIAMIQLNVISVVHLTKLFAREMVVRKSGRILITSSVAAVTPTPFLAVYSATKAFDYAFAEAIADELKDSGVTVTALMPDATETNFFDRAGMSNTEIGRAEKASASAVANAGYRAMMKGTDHVLVPFKAEMHAAMAALFPKRMTTAMARAE
jgi:uncharacterized protein